MAPPRVTDGGDGLQIWTIATNVLNKIWWTAVKGWSPSLGLGEGLASPHRKKSAGYETLHKDSDLGLKN